MKSDAIRPLRAEAIVSEITAQLGRPLRILHIGNIANNAYNNARIQRQYGIEADVICFDYYHVMATPEWEDGGLTTAVNAGLPNWWASNLKGFKRPDWYVQGPLHLCLDYLAAFRLGQKSRCRLLKWELENAYIDLLRENAIVNQSPWTEPRSWTRTATPPLLLTVQSALERAPQKLSLALNEIRCLALWPLLAAAVAEPPRIWGAGLAKGLYRQARRVVGRSDRDDTALRQELTRLVPGGEGIGWGTAAARVAKSLSKILVLLPLLPLVGPARLWSRRTWPRPTMPTLNARQLAAEEFMAAHVSPEVDQQTRVDLKNQLVYQSLPFAPLLKHYDIVQGYSIDGLIPLANGHSVFASYEHGTLRELPFENSLTGLVCNIAYRNSPAVFVTNTDVLPSIERLGLMPERVHYLPHAFDDRKLMKWRDLHRSLRPSDNEVVFFSPTRQHWKDENRSLTKGNDVMLRAAGRLWSEGRRFRLVMVEWGQDLAATRQLIGQLGFAGAVSWVAPMGKQDLWRTYCTSHAVLDQFVLPALGGVGFETLTLGCRLITRTDQPTLGRFFGAEPPVLPAADIDQVYCSMSQVLEDPADKAEIGAAGRQWIDQWHSARRTVSIQAQVYLNLLKGQGALAPQKEGVA
ncbi:MAG: glycosyltransferase [Hyphomicrobiaceae bacterium]